MNIRVVLVAISVLISACDSDPRVTFGFQDDGMRRFVLAGLEERGIWFQREGVDRITMYEKDIPVVEKLGAEFGGKTIPFGRSIGVNSMAQAATEDALIEAGVEYHISNYGAATLPPDAEDIGMSADWIVFEPGHEARGFEIVNEVNEHFDFSAIGAND